MAITTEKSKNHSKMYFNASHGGTMPMQLYQRSLSR